jgi:hypothetical protein
MQFSHPLAGEVRWSHRAGIALVVTAISICAATGAIAQVCPAGSYYINDAQGSVSWHQPTLDASYTNGVWTSKASYDATTGDLALSLTPSDLSHASVAVLDSFELIGLAPGFYATVTAIFDVNASAGASSDCDTTVFACQVVFAGAEFNGFFSYGFPPLRVRSGNTDTVSRSVAVPLSFTGGQRADWNYVVSVSREGLPASLISCTATAHLHFTGVPDGMRIASCWGYGTSATPATRGTWGSLKIRYR